MDSTEWLYNYRLRILTKNKIYFQKRYAAYCVLHGYAGLENARW